MTGIDISPNRETDFDDDESFPSSPIGALNPLMLENPDGKFNISKLHSINRHVFV